jgi:hypothetical protein
MYYLWPLDHKFVKDVMNFLDSNIKQIVLRKSTEK